MRDHVLGVRAVTGRGEVIRSGGRVLKNVTGLDLCKLLTGSHGTLGVITEITLKVLPAPEATGTLVLPGLDAEAGVAALSAALGSPYGVSGAAWLPAEAAAPHRRRSPASAARSRWSGSRISPPSVAYRTGRLRDELGDRRRARSSTTRRRAPCGERCATLAPLPAEPRRRGLARLGAPLGRPGGAAALADAVGARGYLDWGGGLVWLAGPADAATHAAVEAAAKRRRRHLDADARARTVARRGRRGPAGSRRRSRASHGG